MSSEAATSCARRAAKTTASSSESERDDWPRARRSRRSRPQPRSRQRAAAAPIVQTPPMCGARPGRSVSALFADRRRRPCNVRRHWGNARGSRRPPPAASRKAPSPRAMEANMPRATISRGAARPAGRHRAESGARCGRRRSRLRRAAPRSREARILADVNGGRVELHELGVGDQRSRFGRHRHAFSAALRRIGRDAIEPPDPARREHQRRRGKNEASPFALRVMTPIARPPSVTMRRRSLLDDANGGCRDATAARASMIARPRRRRLDAHDAPMRMRGLARGLSRPASLRSQEPKATDPRRARALLAPCRAPSPHRRAPRPRRSYPRRASRACPLLPRPRRCRPAPKRRRRPDRRHAARAQ